MVTLLSYALVCLHTRISKDAYTLLPFQVSLKSTANREHTQAGTQITRKGAAICCQGDGWEDGSSTMDTVSLGRVFRSISGPEGSISKLGLV